jgi:hypothetical protein
VHVMHSGANHIASLEGRRSVNIRLAASNCDAKVPVRTGGPSCGLSPFTSKDHQLLRLAPPHPQLER